MAMCIRKGLEMNLRTKLYYDYDELYALLGAEIDGMNEELNNPYELFIRETKNTIIETTLNDYFNSGRVLRYHNRYCIDHGYDDKMIKEEDNFIFEEDRRILKDYLKSVYPNFVNTLIVEYKQEQDALQKIEQNNPSPNLQQIREKRIAAEKQLENIINERKEIIEDNKTKTQNAIMTIELVFAILTWLATFFIGLLGIIFKPLLLIASFTLFAGIGFTLATIKDVNKNFKKYN